MKKLLPFLFILIQAASSYAQPDAPVSIQVFYDDLAPYGRWLYDNNHKYVWVPDVPAGFRPYVTNGHWTITEYGSTWVSGYPWGWAAFHYGRWMHDATYKWVWIPDTQWGPGWVVWRSNGDYYGWSPMTPGLSLDASMGASYYAPNDWWIFIPHDKLLNNDFARYSVSPGKHADLIKGTTTMKSTGLNNNYRYITGPNAEGFGRTRKNFTPKTVRATSKPGKMMEAATEVSLYKPDITKEPAGNTPAPKKYTQSAVAIGKAAPIGTASHSSAPAHKTKSTGKKKKGG